MIDVAEAILATTGISAVLLNRAPALNARDRIRVSRFDRELSGLARQLVRGKLRRPYRRQSCDYEKWLTILSEPPQPNQLSSAVSKLPPRWHLVAAALLATSGRAYQVLASAFPIIVRQQFFAAKNLRPPDIFIGRFESVLSVLDDPLSAFDLIATCRLQVRQAHAIRDVYPSLYLGIGMAIFSAATKELADHPSWDCRFEQGIATFLGAESLSVGMRAALQHAQDQVRQQKQQENAPRKSDSDAPKLTATRSERPELENAT